jgi:hypothetical protein
MPTERKLIAVALDARREMGSGKAKKRLREAMASRSSAVRAWLSLE